MLLNLETAGKNQGTGTIATIPPDSVIWVSLSLKHPRNAAEQGLDPLLFATSSGLQQIRVKLTVAGGSFAGKEIYHNFTIDGATTPGQKKAVEISLAQLRAILEDVRDIKPDDDSPEACAKRRVEIKDLEGMKFPIRVGCERSNQTQKKDPGLYYVNNTLKSIITVSDPEWTAVHAAPYELITKNEIPEFRAASAAAPSWEQPAANTAAPSWGSNNPDNVPF